MSDERLVSLSQAGDVQAFDHLVTRWESSIYAYLRRTLGNREEARDLCQETLVRAYLNIGGLQDGSKFKTWLFRIALNLCRDRFRSARARTATATFDEQGPDGVRAAVERTETMAPDLRAIRGDLIEELERALKSLPEEQREAILLREYQGLTSEEIGVMVGVPAATIRTRIFYGLKTVRRTLRERGFPGRRRGWSMNDDPRMEKLIALLYGELPEEEERELRRQLVTDAALRAEWEELCGTRSILGRWEVNEPAPRVVFVQRVVEAAAADSGSEAGDPRTRARRRQSSGSRPETIWSGLGRILAAPAWGLAAAAVCLAVLGLAHFRIDRADGGFAFHFGAPAAPVSTYPLAAFSPATSPAGTIWSSPAMVPATVPATVPSAAPPAVPPATQVGLQASDAREVSPLRPATARNPGLSAEADRDGYVTRRELDAYTRSMGEAMLNMIADYTRQRDQAVTQFVQTALSGVSDRQADDYRELRTQIEDLGSGVLQDQARTRARLDYLTSKGGQSKPERIGAAPRTSEGEKP